MKRRTRSSKKTKVALVVPHLYVCDALRSQVIFSPGELVRELVRGLAALPDLEVTLFTPGPVKCAVKNITADWSGLTAELERRKYPLTTLASRHPSLFVALARQLQAEIVATTYARANAGEFDVVHVYTNEEDLALQFAELCDKPVLFTHHDPYNFLIKYKSVFPRYRHNNYISTSMVQQKTAPTGTNFVANIYHGLDETKYQPSFGRGEYFVYSGRLVAEKGVELAVRAARYASLPLKIIGKYYQEGYFEEQIQPLLNEQIEYLGFQRGEAMKDTLRHAAALIVPSRFAEPFGMVAIEALALGTPVIASKNGALPEIIQDGKNGFLVDVAEKAEPNVDQKSINQITAAMQQIWQANDGADTKVVDSVGPRSVTELRQAARQSFLDHFTLDRMVAAHAALYRCYNR